VHYRWIDQMAGYVKQLAPRQLVAAGTEGFFTEESGGDLVAYNPGGQVEAVLCPLLVQAMHAALHI
jgi:hypothetical protein